MTDGGHIILGGGNEDSERKALSEKFRNLKKMQRHPAGD
jgi:hypothetical protein